MTGFDVTGSCLVGQVAEETYFPDCEGFSVPDRSSVDFIPCTNGS